MYFHWQHGRRWWRAGDHQCIATIANCTISGNQATATSGGVEFQTIGGGGSKTLTISNSTIVNNVPREQVDCGDIKRWSSRNSDSAEFNHCQQLDEQSGDLGWRNGYDYLAGFQPQRQLERPWQY